MEKIRFLCIFVCEIMILLLYLIVLSTFEMNLPNKENS